MVTCTHVTYIDSDIVCVCAVVRLDAAEAALAAVDAASDVEASDDDDTGNDDNSGQHDVGEEVESESTNSDSEYSSEDDIPLAQRLVSKKDSKLTWRKCSKFVGVRPKDTAVDLDVLETRREWGKVDYFEQYINDDMFSAFCDSTNVRSVKETGRSLNCTYDEMKRFFCIILLIGCLNFPQMRMYWSGVTRVPRIADAMARDRFFKIRNNLKVVDDDAVSAVVKESDRLWKVRPLLEKVKQTCLTRMRDGEVSIDEQMIPFSGSTSLKQYVPNKPNPVGLKSFVLANPDGLVLDFRVYVGQATFADIKFDHDNIGLGAKVILALSSTLPAGTVIYCDRYFTTISLLSELAKKQLYCTGTIQKNRINEVSRVLSSDKEFMKKERGTSELVQSSDRKICVVKWLDNKPIVMASTCTGIEPVGLVKRWSKKDKKYIQVSCPAVISKYNAKMGGVDMSDRMISYYRTRARTKKWTVRTIFHFFDLSVTNAWIQYRNERRQFGDRKKEIAQVFFYLTTYLA